MGTAALVGQPAAEETPECLSLRYDVMNVSYGREKTFERSLRFP
jgi:hypothetical protein